MLSKFSHKLKETILESYLWPLVKFGELNSLKKAVIASISSLGDYIC